MNFFKTVFTDDPNPQYSDDDQQQEEEEQSLNPNPNPTSPAATQSAWSFGGLIKTLATKSESVIETYRRDLEEFGSGLKKETTVIREVASRVVKDLPGSLEIGASVAQDSLESLGEAIDDFGTTVWKETAEIISQGKEALILAAEEDADSSSDTNSNNRNQQFGDRGFESKPFSRFDSQLNAIRVNESTYCEEPDDLVDYGNWKLGFVIDEESEEIASLIGEIGVMEGIYEKLVPSLIDAESFWCKYFYRVYKLKQAEDARAKLVNRVISGDEEEDLTWDFDDDEEENKETNVSASTTEELSSDKNSKANKNDASGESSSQLEVDGDKASVAESVKVENQTEGEVALTEKSDISEEESSMVEEKGDNGDSCKNSDFSIISTQPSLPEEEDIGWDDIEDMGSGDESKAAVSGSPNRADLRKRLSAAEDDEDLTWDIEDDDEPVKP